MNVETLWYTRCPMPTASGIAIERGSLDEEFAPDGIEVLSLRASASRKTRESHFTIDDVELVDLPEAETFLGDEEVSQSGTLWSVRHGL